MHEGIPEDVFKNEEITSIPAWLKPSSIWL